MTTTLDTFLEKLNLPERALTTCRSCGNEDCINIGVDQPSCVDWFKHPDLEKKQRPLRKTSRDNQAWELLAKLKGKSIEECKAAQEKRLAKGGRK